MPQRVRYHLMAWQLHQSCCLTCYYLTQAFCAHFVYLLLCVCVHAYTLYKQLASVVEVYSMTEEIWRQKKTKGTPPLGLYNNAFTVIGERYSHACLHACRSVMPSLRQDLIAMHTDTVYSNNAFTVIGESQISYPCILACRYSNDFTAIGESSHACMQPSLQQVRDRSHRDQ